MVDRDAFVTTTGTRSPAPPRPPPRPPPKPRPPPPSPAVRVAALAGRLTRQTAYPATPMITTNNTSQIAPRRRDRAGAGIGSRLSSEFMRIHLERVTL